MATVQEPTLSEMLSWLTLASPPCQQNFTLASPEERERGFDVEVGPSAGAHFSGL